MKKITKIILIISLSIFVALIICAVDHELVSGVYESKLIIDYSNPLDEITHGATGFLYGLAEPNVPDGRALYAISPKVLSTRVPNGLQHPSGDIAKVSEYFFENGGENIIIYMQDIYPDWYYAYREDYLITMSHVIDTIIPINNSDKFIYQPFNEMNNGVWYGDFSQYDNRLKFYNAFKDAYNLIKVKTSGAPVGGPAYTDYNPDLIKEFLEYCIKNDCVPDVMIWHELFWYSTYGIRDNVKNYRNIEKSLGLDEIRIIIDEYGTFKDIGTPGKMLQYIASFEETNVEGCLAFWRLPNNMNDMVTNNNMPTSQWWLYEWYSEMQGLSYNVMKSNDTIPYFSAITTVDEKKATIICGGGDGKAKIDIIGLNLQKLFKDSKSIRYEVEYLDFEGLTAPSLGGTKLIIGQSKIINGNSLIKLDDISPSRAYRIKIYPTNESINANYYDKYDIARRYEAEEAYYENAYLRSHDQIRYASSGGGVNVNRSGFISFNVNASYDGLYALELAYISNPTIGNVRLNPRIKVYIDNHEETHVLPNTLTNESSNEYVITSYLTKGSHKLTLKYDYGEFTIDFIDMKYLSTGYTDYVKEYKTVPINSKNNNECFVVIPKSGYYSTNDNNIIEKINGVPLSQNVDKVFMEYGLNIITLKENLNELTFINAIDGESILYSIEYAENASNYVVQNSNSITGYYAKDVPTNYPINFNVYVKDNGYYAVNIIYSQCQTNGIHAYNVKLVERYSSILVNDVFFDTVYFANTYSNFNFSEKTIYVYLNSGNNTISFINNGDDVWNNLKPLLPNIAGIKIYDLK